MENFSIQTQTINVDNHFREATKMVGLGKVGKRVVTGNMLTRYACYLIAQYSDPQKEDIATLFGVHTAEDIKNWNAVWRVRKRKLKKPALNCLAKLKD